jgi:hypothetical protein
MTEKKSGRWITSLFRKPSALELQIKKSEWVLENEREGGFEVSEDFNSLGIRHTCTYLGHVDGDTHRKLQSELAYSRARAKELEAEVAVARERLGPAGYKIIQENADLRSRVKELELDIKTNISTACHAAKHEYDIALLQRENATLRARLGKLEAVVSAARKWCTGDWDGPAMRAAIRELDGEKKESKFKEAAIGAFLSKKK